MKRLWMWAIAAVVPVAIVAAAVWSPRIVPGASGMPADASLAQQAPRQIGIPLGMSGCTAAACHGAAAETMLTTGPAPGVWQCAATFWLAADPHTQAYAALESDLARDIMARLKGPNTEATNDLRCLACHTNPSLAVPDTPFASLRAEGVGCEACHGNSSGWLHDHTTWTVRKSDEGFDRTSMAKLYDLGERAITCAGCHVGAPADFPVKGYPVRDMNHDMIAAGHPRLNFDFADYQHRLPPHWLERDRATGEVVGPGFETSAWLIGRVAHAEAACRLLEDRAKRAEANDVRTPWPEFAEYQCVSCHHSLGKGYPPPAPGETRRAGSPRWQEIWPAEWILTTEAIRKGTIDPLEYKPSFSALRQAVERPFPRTRNVEPAAADLARRFSRLREQFGSNMGQAQAFSDQLFRFASSSDLERVNRDMAEQLYHGLAARERARLTRAAQAGQPAQPPEAFESLRKHLLVERGNLSFRIPEGDRADLKKLLSRESSP